MSKKRLMNAKGFTLIELIIIIAILGILASIAVPRLHSFAERARIAADQATVRSLNSVTPPYRISNKESDPFADETKDSAALMGALVVGGYLTSSVEPQSKDATFAWFVDEEHWYLLFPDPFYLITLADGLSMGSGGHAGFLKGVYMGSSKDIVIPASLDGTPLASIWQDTFKSKGLIAVSFQQGSQIKRIHARAFYDNNLAIINLPDSVERIDLWSFRNNNLTEIKLPTNLHTIEQRAFDGNDLSKITIGSDVAVIQEKALGNFTDSFKQAYETGGAGTYTLSGDTWVKSSN